MKKPRNPLIYVIDANISYRKIIRSCLESTGYCNIRLLESTGECILTGGSPDIIILDNNQGKYHLSGIEFLRVYRNKFPATHFLFLSSNTDIDIAVNAMKLGAYDYIVKSKMGLEKVVERVDKLVTLYKKDRHRRAIHRLTLVILGIFSVAFLLAIILYIHQ